jgi:hypothetical protein
MDRNRTVAVLRDTLTHRNIISPIGAEGCLLTLLCRDEGLLHATELYFDPESSKVEASKAVYSDLEWNACVEVVLDDVQRYAGVISDTLLLSGLMPALNFVLNVGFEGFMSWSGNDRRAHVTVLRSKVSDIFCDPRKLVKANEALKAELGKVGASVKKVGKLLGECIDFDEPAFGKRKIH